MGKAFSCAIHLLTTQTTTTAAQQLSITLCCAQPLLAYQTYSLGLNKYMHTNNIAKDTHISVPSQERMALHAWPLYIVVIVIKGECILLDD